VILESASGMVAYRAVGKTGATGTYCWEDRRGYSGSKSGRRAAAAQEWSSRAQEPRLDAMVVTAGQLAGEQGGCGRGYARKNGVVVHVVSGPYGGGIR